MARERRQPVRRLIWGLVRLIPAPVRRLLWQGVLELPAPIRRFFWWGVVRKDRLRLDVAVPDSTETSVPAAERRLRYPTPQTYDVLLFRDHGGDGSGPEIDGLARRFAANGHRVFYVGALANPHAAPALRALSEGIYSVSASPRARAGGDSEAPPRRMADGLYWTSLRYDYSIVDAVCFVDSPNAVSTARQLRHRFGWKVVLDTRFGIETTGTTAGDRDALDPVDLVIVNERGKSGSPGTSTTPALALSSLPSADDIGWRELTTALFGLYPRVTIILLMYNGLEYNRLCLTSIFGKTAYPNFDVVVVDNNSTDGTRPYLDEITAAHPNVTVLLNSSNAGYTKANNQGAAIASGDYLVFLNNDIIVTRSWLSRLVFHLRDRRVGLVGPSSSWPGNESGIETNYRTLTELHAFADRYTRDHEGRTYDAGRMVFFCATMRRATWEEIGPLDERFSKGVSFEDDDYTMRVRERGYRVIYAEDAFVHHWGVGTNSRRDIKAHWRLIELNRRQFEDKWGVTWDPNRGVRARKA